MRSAIILLSLLLAAALCGGDQVLQEISWARLKQEGRLGAGEVLPADGKTTFEHLKLHVRNDVERPVPIAILTVENPPVTTTQYSLTGQVRYEDVQGKACLEMWSHFPDGSTCFSRTLAAAGPMQHLEGSSGWRPFVLPFTSQPGMPPPAKLVFNVVMAGNGVVYLSPLTLTQAEPAKAGWWSGATGGIIGAVLGCFLGFIGCLTGILSSRGKARGFVTGLMAVTLCCGVAALVLGLVALAVSQPYAVYYPLLLVGVLGSVLPAVMLPTIRRRYDAIELRKMEAQDA